MAFSQLLKGKHKKDKKIFAPLIRWRCNLLSKQETFSGFFYNYLVIRTLISPYIKGQVLLGYNFRAFPTAQGQILPHI